MPNYISCYGDSVVKLPEDNTLLEAGSEPCGMHSKHDTPNFTPALANVHFYL